MVPKNLDEAATSIKYLTDHTFLASLQALFTIVRLIRTMPLRSMPIVPQDPPYKFIGKYAVIPQSTHPMRMGRRPKTYTILQEIVFYSILLVAETYTSWIVDA